MYLNFSLFGMLEITHIGILAKTQIEVILNYYFRLSVPKKSSISKYDWKVTVFCFWIPIQKFSRLLFLSFLTISIDNDYNSTLQEAEIPIADHQACEHLYNPVSFTLPELEPVIKEDIICAGDAHTTKDSCKVRVCSWRFLTWDLNVDPGFPICKQQWIRNQEARLLTVILVLSWISHLTFIYWLKSLQLLIWSNANSSGHWVFINLLNFYKYITKKCQLVIFFK